MVTTVTPATDPRNRASAGQGFDGVVRVSVGGFFGTGVLLYDGRAVLTAAHLFGHGTTAATLTLETLAGSTKLTGSSVLVHPSYDATQGNNDLALVWLSSPAPVAAERYTLYRSADELGQTMTLVGYGATGTGATGDVDPALASPLRLKANNQFEADAVQLKTVLGQGIGWSSTPGTQLIADFDNGSKAHDALGLLLDVQGLGLGSTEGLIAPGDSGGPAFIKGQVAGIASYTASLTYGTTLPDVDTQNNSSYGEIAAWQRVSNYQQWVDQSLRAQYAQAPTKPSEVVKAVPEGASGSSLVYFLLQFVGVRPNPALWLSVDFTTRNGSATAGQDYMSTHGTLVIYPNETQAVVAVEVLGDTTPEPDETFYLDVSNPVGGTFPLGVITLTAVRTILNDDPGQLV
jgi:hypothetical protein